MRPIPLKVLTQANPESLELSLPFDSVLFMLHYKPAIIGEKQARVIWFQGTEEWMEG